MSRTLAERLAARDAGRFVGRERELQLLESLLVEEPPAQVVLLHGPGGIGKSTLLREVARRGSAKGFTPRLVEGRELAPVPGEIEHALNGVEHDVRPLVLFDTYERMSAAGAWLRARLLPSLPASSVVILAGRTPPEPEWFQNGWEQLAIALPLEPLAPDVARDLLRAHGITDDELARRVVDWAEGSPLALALAAQSLREGGWTDANLDNDPNLAREIIRRLTRTELDGGNLDVAAVAAIARTCDGRMLRAALPDVDPDEAMAWLRSRTFAEPVGGGIALHEMVRQAIRADLRARDAQRERELRRRIADHLHARATRGEPRLLVDLAELVDNPALRWGLGADGSTTYRPDLWRPEDAAIAEARFARLTGGAAWWRATAAVLDSAPELAVTVRDAADELCGLAICTTPADAPAAAEADLLLGPWLAYARAEFADAEVLVWRDSIDLVGHGDLASPVLAILNTAALLRSGLRNPSHSFLPIDPDNEAAVTFARAANAQHIAELDVELDGKVTECHVVFTGSAGVLGGVLGAVYGELGLPAPRLEGDPVDNGATRLTVDDVRDALRNLHHPLDLAASPLARGTTQEERAASARAAVDDAVARAFGDTPDERLLRRVIERGYLDPDSGHEAAADELHVSRATYFRRLRTASQRVGEYLVAEHSSA